MRSFKVDPIERLGCWDGIEFVPVGAGSIEARNVHVMTHGWGPGMRPIVDAAPGFVRVWDPAVETESGSRFDRWFAPLASAILDDDPSAVVLAYSWIDESATGAGATESVKSQLRTTVNGQRLAVALRHALSEGDHALHIIGYSHGAKVATVAAALIDPFPQHLTILDSPDNLLPALGGALNDLDSYLRLLSPDLTADESFVEADAEAREATFVDNYPSHFGRHYGTEHGLGAVVDVALDPEAFPIEDAPSPHAYAWSWYLETARNPALGVGYAWSPLRENGARAPASQLRQTPDQDDPFTIEEDPDVTPASVGARLRSRVRREAEVSSVLTTDKPRTHGFYWRRSGDLWATGRVNWIEGPDDALVRVYTNRTERARSVKGWSPHARRAIHVPLGGARWGPMFVTIELASTEPATVEVGQAVAVNGFVLPRGAEFAAWLRPLFWLSIGGLLSAILLGSRRIVRIRRRTPPA